MEKRIVRITCIVLCLFMLVICFFQYSDAFTVEAYVNANDKFDEELKTIISNGDIDIFTDAKCASNEVLMPTGTALDINTKYYVKNKTTNSIISGYQCYIYAQAVYNKLFGETPYHATGLKLSEVVLSGQNISSLSYEKLKDAKVNAGAYLRTTANSSGAYDSNSGHSQIILDYDENGITVLEANYDWKGSIGINSFTWEKYNGVYFSKKYLSHIVQPTAENYEAFKYSGVIKKLNELVKVYTNGVYFTGTGYACYIDDGEDCSLKNIPSRGGLPQGSVVASMIGNGFSCNGFGRYVFYYLFGTNPFKASKTNTPVIGDCIQFGGNKNHTAIYLSEDENNYYVYDCNWGHNTVNGWVTDCEVQYNHAIKKNWATEVTFYHAINYDEINGHVTTATPTYDYKEIDEGTYYIINDATGEYLTVKDNKDAIQQPVIVSELCGEAGQKYYVSADESGCKIQPFCSATRYINVYYTNENSMPDGSKVTIHTTEWGVDQHWLFQAVDNGYVIHNAQFPGMVLAKDESDVVVNTYSIGNDSQVWRLVKVENSDGKTKNEIRRQIAAAYAAALKLSGRNSFNGWCGGYVGYQLKVLGINKSYVGGDGKNQFDKYKGLSTTTGGYDVKLYPADDYTVLSAINTITESGAKDVYNILFGFEWSSAGEGGNEYGHVVFVHAIIEGQVYYSESSKWKSLTEDEGEPIACDINTFATRYRNDNFHFDGAVHFVKSKNIAKIYIVAYNANGGTGEPDPQIKMKDDPLVLPTTRPTRDDYVFLGWSEDAGALTADYKPGAEYNDDKDVVLYSVWQLRSEHKHDKGEKTYFLKSHPHEQCYICSSCGETWANHEEKVFYLECDVCFRLLLDAADIDGDGAVSSDDAVYLLRHTLFPKSYPVKAQNPFFGAKTPTSDDAVYLLRYTLFPESYPVVFNE